jgi:hypothetical protein
VVQEATFKCQMFISHTTSPDSTAAQSALNDVRHCILAFASSLRTIIHPFSNVAIQSSIIVQRTHQVISVHQRSGVSSLVVSLIGLLHVYTLFALIGTTARKVQWSSCWQD